MDALNVELLRSLSGEELVVVLGVVALVGRGDAVVRAASVDA